MQFPHCGINKGLLLLNTLYCVQCCVQYSQNCFPDYTVYSAHTVVHAALIEKMFLISMNLFFGLFFYLVK